MDKKLTKRVHLVCPGDIHRHKRNLVALIDGHIDRPARDRAELIERQLAVQSRLANLRGMRRLAFYPE